MKTEVEIMALFVLQHFNKREERGEKRQRKTMSTFRRSLARGCSCCQRTCTGRLHITPGRFDHKRALLSGSRPLSPSSVSPCVEVQSPAGSSFPWELVSVSLLNTTSSSPLPTPSSVETPLALNLSPFQFQTFLFWPPVPSFSQIWVLADVLSQVHPRTPTPTPTPDSPSFSASRSIPQPPAISPHHNPDM